MKEEAKNQLIGRFEEMAHISVETTSLFANLIDDGAISDKKETEAVADALTALNKALRHFGDVLGNGVK